MGAPPGTCSSSVDVEVARSRRGTGASSPPPEEEAESLAGEAAWAGDEDEDAAGQADE